MNPLISVILPVYKSEKYIHNCIESIINQTYSDIEIIVVSDGCIDSSIIIAEALLSSSSRPYKILKQENKGVAAARNNGISNASGDWVITVDSDDCLDIDTLRLLMSNIREEKVATFDYGNNLPLGRKIIVDSEDVFRISGYDAFHKYYDRIYDIVAPALLIKKNFLLENRIMYDNGCLFAEDDLFVWKVLCCVESILYVKKPLYNYIFHYNSTMTTSNLAKFKSVKEYAYNIEKNFVYKSKNVGELKTKVRYRFLIGVLHVVAKLHNYKEFRELLEFFELGKVYKNITNKKKLCEHILFWMPLYVPYVCYKLFRIK